MLSTNTRLGLPSIVLIFWKAEDTWYVTFPRRRL
jgi:hypothetical protein